MLVALEGGLALLSDRLIADRLSETADLSGERALLCLGDSVTEGYGLEPGAAWPQQLGGARPGQRVVNLGLSSATSNLLVSQVIPRLRRTPRPAARPIFLVMIGHNDFFQWPETRTVRFPTGGQPTRGLRTLRLLRRALRPVTADSPALAMDAWRQAAFADNLTALHDYADEVDGEVVLLTYILPGTPPADLSVELSEIITLTRSAQSAINEHIRQTAADLDLSLIDTDAYAAARFPSQWSPAYFLDNIHLTAHGSGILADILAQRLAAMGLQPPAPPPPR